MGRYSCDSNGKCKDVGEGKGRYDDAKCGGTCVSSSTEKKYSCNSNGECVEKVGGRYTDATCGGSCSGPNTTKKYSCKSGSCVEDVNGTYSESTCGGNCSSNNNTNDTCPYPNTPFSNSKEGNEFRKWVHENHKDWAVDNNLDFSYPKYNNCKYMRKAYNKFGKEYEESGNGSGNNNVSTGTMTADKQKELFDKLISSGRIYDGFLIQIAPDVKDKVGKNDYEWTYIKKYTIERDATGKIIKIGNVFKNKK